MSCRLHRDCLPRRHAGPRVITGADGTGVECGHAAQTPPWLHAPPARPDASSVRRAAGPAQEHPLGLAIGAAAIGFLAGLLVPSTRVEDEQLGLVADQVKDKIKETGQEAVARGKDVAQQVAQSATETAKEETKQHGEAMADSAREHAQDVREEIREEIRDEAGGQPRLRTTR